MLVARFVDSIDPARTVRLDLNDGTVWRLLATSRFDPPPAKRARVSTLLADGAHYPESAYDDRVLELRLLLQGSSGEEVAGQVQLLARELDRVDGNIFEYQPDGLTHPVFFRTRRLGLDVAHMPADVDRLDVEVNVPAEQFGFGLSVTLPAVTVYNDPTERTEMNSNAFFEVDASNWTASGATVARSTLQAHEGVASLLLTPDGVSASAVARSELLPAVVGQVWRASVWVRCAVSRNVSLNIDWRTSGGAFISTSTQTIAVSAAVWTYFDLTGTAPATTGQVGLTVSMGSTPPGSNTLFIDEARLRTPGGPGGMCIDVTGVLGDVDADMVIRETGLEWFNSSVLFACRCHGDPDATPFHLPAEEMSLGTDTTLPGNDSTASGPGSNFARISFATNATLTPARLSKVYWPAAPSSAARGTYRVYVRVRRSSATGTVRVELRAGPDGSVVPSTKVVTTAESTAWQMLDFGLISIPFGADPRWWGPSGVALPVKGLAVHVHAARDSGTSTLDVDCLLWPPHDEMRLAVDAGNDATGHGYVLDSANDLMWAWEDIGGTVVTSAGDLVPLGGLPTLRPGVTNRIYVLSHFRGQALPSGSTQLQITYWPRYLYLRAS